MASKKKSTDPNPPTPPVPVPVRSILKKVGSDLNVSTSSTPKGKKKSITFDDNVTMRWSDGTIKINEEHMACDELGAEGKTSNGEASSCSLSSLETHCEMDVAGKDSRQSRSKMSGFRTKVGGILRRSGRTQVQGGIDDLESSRPKMKRCASEMSASLDQVNPATRKSHSLPRQGSFDSAELFSHSNKSLRSKLLRFGRHFKLESHGGGDDGEPVLTKVTPLKVTPLAGATLGG